MTPPAIPFGITAIAVKTKPFWQSRTILIQALGALVAVGAAADQLPFVKQHAAEFTFGWAVLNVLVRFVTTEGIGPASATKTVTDIDAATAVKVVKPESK